MPAVAAQAAAPAPPVRIAAPDSAEEREADRIADERPGSVPLRVGRRHHRIIGG